MRIFSPRGLYRAELDPPSSPRASSHAGCDVDSAARPPSLAVGALRAMGPKGNKVRPLIIQGHERPLTMVKYNREGDLLFTTAKDHRPCMWYADNGERIGTFDGHNGTVWCIDVNCARPRLCSTRPPAPLTTPLCALRPQSTARIC